METLFGNLGGAAVTKLFLALALLGGLSTILGASDLARAGVPVTFTVDTTADDATKTACTVAANDCSLRGAIADANANPGALIAFNIGSGLQTITVTTSNLPTITAPVFIDGTTQPGFSGSPLIEINGNNIGAPGLTINGGATTVRGLIINRANSHGIQLSTNGGNTIKGNYIGTESTGTLDLGNSLAGINISSGSGNMIGGTTAADRNIISGNNQRGVIIAGAGSNVILGNYIGTNAAGSASLGNTLTGVAINNSPNNTIGGTVAGARNVISGNSQFGVDIFGSVGTGNVVQGNFIGTDATGTLDLGNSAYGVSLGSPSGTLGGAGAANLISGNNGNGVSISASGNTVQGNFIGTDAAGTADLGNSGDGISVQSGATNVLIGGTDSAKTNVISGNDLNGITLNGGGETVQGNRIGTNAAGTAAIGNSGYGVAITGTPAGTLGGTTAGAGNLISGNGAAGVFIAATSGNMVQGNLIGTDLAGTAPIPNDTGVDFSNAGTNTIGGSSAGARNIISGNTFDGVSLDGFNITSNTVDGNYIGTDITGTADLGNGRDGVRLGQAGTTGNSIGAAVGNLISGNDEDGIQLYGAPGNSVGKNYIGTKADGVSALGNSMFGVRITSASNNIIGPPGSPNIISFNGSAGVWILFDGTGNQMRANSIGHNGGLGIDLGTQGVNPNDPADGDAGANNLQNFPVLQSVAIGASNTTITASLNSAGSTSFTVDFYYSSACDASGNGEGETYIGQNMLTTDGGGNTGNVSSTFPVVVPAGRFITATATDPSGNTSEFSACIASLNDADDDDDGYTDVVEAGTPLCNGVNDDAFDDAVVDDGCPGGPAQAGSFSEAQFHIGTSPQAPCGGSGWPSNVFDSGPSVNKLDIQDLTSFLAPVRIINSSPGDAAFNARYDLVPGRGVFAKFININDMTAQLVGTTGFPPMFNGQRAYNHVCPFPP